MTTASPTADTGAALPSFRPPPGDPRFAHASEAEFARILDFYAVRWEYEPHTYPILWSLDGAVVESFAPDFYLPDLDLYVELTTLRQKLVRKKNRKLRRLRECYPDLRVKLFYARDFRALMLKYGKLAIADELSGTVGQVAPPLPAAAASLGVAASAEDRAAPAGVAATAVPAPATRRARRRASSATPAGVVVAAASPSAPTRPRHRDEAAAR